MTWACWIGRWDGDTLVVDRVGFDPRVWLDVESHPHSDKLHIVERYHRPDLGHMEIEITVDDPGVLAKPYTLKRVADLAHEEIFEYICQENNRDVQHMVSEQVSTQHWLPVATRRVHTSVNAARTSASAFVDSRPAGPGGPAQTRGVCPTM